MDKEQNYLTIGEVSKLLNISPATLRFWQDNKIFKVKRGDNQYRKYSISDLIAIAEIAFYRHLGIPVKEMRNFNNYGLNDYQEKLDELAQSLQEKMCFYKMMSNLVHIKQEHIKTIRYLQNVSYVPDSVPFKCIVRFDYNDREKLIRYTQNPSLYVRWMDSNRPEHDIRGIIQDIPRKGDQILWQKKNEGRWLSFLITENATHDYKSNINEKLSIIHERYKTGSLLAMFLLSETTNASRIDYLKGFVEII